MSGVLALANFLISIPVSLARLWHSKAGTRKLTNLFAGYVCVQIKEYPLPGSFEEEQRIKAQRAQAREESTAQMPVENER